MYLFPLAYLAAASSLALAQSGIEDISFGHKQPLSPNSYSIPGWSILGEGHVPQVLSNKVVMTPPVGGNKRGALWSQKKSTLTDWTLDLEFRVSGQDRSGGNMQLWYVQNGADVVSTSSIYTVGKFDGMAIVIDTVGGVQKIRGFLNDGKIDYKSNPMIEGLAFGHCDYKYRDLGRPSKLQVRHSDSGLAVTIDGDQCFTTPKVALPADYTFGMTAASSDPPDSFEIFQFRLASGSSTAYTPDVGTQKSFDSMAALDSIPPPTGQGTNAQFEDLHNRFHALSKAMTNLFNEIRQHTAAEEDRYNEILKKLNLVGSSGGNVGALESRLSNMERLIQELHRDTRDTDHKGQYQKLSAQIEQSHAGIQEHIPNRLQEYMLHHTPRIGFIAFSFMAFQSCCLAFLLWQKYRKSTMPKKFL